MNMNDTYTGLCNKGVIALDTVTGTIIGEYVSCDDSGVAVYLKDAMMVSINDSGQLFLTSPTSQVGENILEFFKQSQEKQHTDKAGNQLSAKQVRHVAANGVFANFATAYKPHSDIVKLRDDQINDKAGLILPDETPKIIGV